MNLVKVPKVNVSVKISYALQQMLKLQMSEANAMNACTKIKITSYSASDLILSRGTKGNNWYFTINGLVTASLKTEKEQSSSVMLYGPGAWFGEHSIINDKPSFLDYTALEDSDFLVMPGETMLQIAKSDPGFSFGLIRMLAWRSQYAGEMLTIMKSGNPPLRLMMGLSQFVEVLSYPNERPPTIGYGDGLKIPMNQTLLANFCGVSRSVFSELIQHLERAKIVIISYGKLEIQNVRAWSAFAARRRSERGQNLNPPIEDLIKDFDLML